MGGWSDAELAATVNAYREMMQSEAAGLSYNKSEAYRALQRQYGRTEGAFEYRMQNISAVLQEMGQAWLRGLRPAKNIGANVKEKLIVLLRQPLDAVSMQQVQEPACQSTAGRRMTLAAVFERDLEVVRRVKERASDGRCECCGELGFEVESGGYYLEAHHVIPLSCDGPDVIWNVVAICPNDHRRAHFAKDRITVRHELIEVLGKYYPDRLGQLRRLNECMSALPDLASQLEADPVT